MKEWLLNSTAPYWLMLLLAVFTFAICLIAKRQAIAEKSNSIFLSFGAVVAVTSVILVGVILEWAIYLYVQNGCIWWVTGKDLGFFKRLLFSLPLFLFITIQILQIKTYKDYVGAYLRSSDLNVKDVIRCTVILLPVLFVAYMVMDWTGVTKPLRDYIFYGILIVGIVLGMGRAFFKNISAVGFLKGFIFTVFAIIIVSGAVVSVFLLFNVVLTLFFEFLIYAGFLLMMKSVVPSMNMSMATQKPNMSNIMRDDAGQLHTSTGERDAVNAKIRAGKDN